MINVLLAALSAGLKLCGFAVTTASDGEQAWQQICQTRPDIVLLDYSMPNRDGREVLILIRSNPQVSNMIAIMLTARSEDMDMIACYEAGADDYFIKPFKLLHLVMRMNALVKRMRDSVANANNATSPFGIQIDEASQTAALHGEVLPLRQQEYLLLKYLLYNANRVLSRDELLNNVWGYEFPGDSRTVDTHISSLREKLSAEPAFRQALITVRGIGYRLIA